MKYVIEVTSDAYELCVFLNDGHEIATPDRTFLAVEITSPREITSKVITADELQTAEYKRHILLVA